jgi:hypothetical protein
MVRARGIKPKVIVRFPNPDKPESDRNWNHQVVRCTP